MGKYTQAELDALLAQYRSVATVKCRLIRPLAGGLPADRKALEAFVEFWLKIPRGSDDFTQAVERIIKEEAGDRKIEQILKEVGDQDTTPPDGELDTKKVYQVNVVRRDDHGPFILDHMIKALMKVAASRLGLFSAKGKIGSKGDIAELGTVMANGGSYYQNGAPEPWKIHLYGDVQTTFEVFRGSVSTAQGKKSIVHHTECVQPGAMFDVKVLWPGKRLTGKDMALIWAAATQIGVGSCLSFGMGRFEVVDMEVAGD